MFIAEPPLYRVDDKRNPFVINKKDYIDRYVAAVSKDYKLGYQIGEDENNVEYMVKSQFSEFLDQTTNYVDDIKMLVDHYKTNDRLLEIILEEFALIDYNPSKDIKSEIKRIDIQHLIDRIGIEFPELYYDDEAGLIKGAINAKMQIIEISEQLIRKSKDLIDIMKHWLPPENGYLVLKDIKKGTEHRLSLLGVLKILKKYQPNILHRFKGLGENDESDLKTTIMDPNTRTLIRVSIGDIENDMGVFQLLRGSAQQDVIGRRNLIRAFPVTRDMIDT